MTQIHPEYPMFDRPERLRDAVRGVKFAAVTLTVIETQCVNLEPSELRQRQTGRGIQSSAQKYYRFLFHFNFSYAAAFAPDDLVQLQLHPQRQTAFHYPLGQLGKLNAAPHR